MEVEESECFREVYLLEGVPLYLALPELLQQHQLGLLQPQLLLQLLNDALPLRWTALLQTTRDKVTHSASNLSFQRLEQSEMRAVALCTLVSPSCPQKVCNSQKMTVMNVFTTHEVFSSLLAVSKL